MNESIEKIFGELNKLYVEIYKTNLILVNDIIDNRCTNIKSIEGILDTLLSCYDEKCTQLFIKLCNYYMTINKENACIYMDYLNKRSDDYEGDENMGLKFLIDILLEDKPSESIRNNEDEVFKMIPELSLCKNFNQNNDWHIYDVYEHILHVVDGVPNNLILRMAALFHDIGKPFFYKEDEFGVGHFYGHYINSKEIFDNFSERYNLDEDLRRKISNLILYHDLNIDKISEDEFNKLINVFDEEGMIMLFELKRSDLLAQNRKFHYMLDDYERQKTRVLSKMNKKKRLI